MPAGTSWGTHRGVAVTLRVVALAIPLAVIAGATLVVSGAFDGSTLRERLAWGPLVALAVFPLALAAEHGTLWLLALADLFLRRLDFEGAAPSRPLVAWRVATPRRAEALVAQARSEASLDPSLVVAVVLGATRHHPVARARAPQAHRYVNELVARGDLTADEARRSLWALDLRLTGEVIAPGDIDRWLSRAILVVPGGPPAAEGRAVVLAEMALKALDLTHNSPPRSTAPSGGWAFLAAFGGTAAVFLVVALVAASPGAQAPGNERARVAGNLVENLPPVAVPDAALATVGEFVVIDVVENDTDPEGDALAVDRFAGAGLGEVERFGAQLRYRARFAGTDTFTYVITDGHGAESSAVVTVKVEAGAA